MFQVNRHLRGREPRHTSRNPVGLNHDNLGSGLREPQSRGQSYDPGTHYRDLCTAEPISSPWSGSSADPIQNESRSDLAASPNRSSVLTSDGPNTHVGATPLT